MINKLFMILFTMVTVSSYANSQAKGISNLITPVSYFVNHVDQLKSVENYLNKYRQASIVGISGMGKTQLARTYAYENKHKYDLIWFFDCNIDLNDQYVKLSKEINRLFKANITEDQALAKTEILHYLLLRKDWLLVFDNLQVSDNVKIQDMVSWEHNGNIILCSQSSSGLNNLIEVNEFKNRDATDLVTIILKEKNHDAIKFLTEEFQGYPILLVHGVQILNNIKGLNYNLYKKMIKETNNKIKLNLELCMKELTPSANELLKKIALINNNKFSKSFLKMVTDNKETIDDDIYQLSKFFLISNICCSSNAFISSSSSSKYSSKHSSSVKLLIFSIIFSSSDK